MKALLITDDNKYQLLTQYLDLSEDEIDEMVGMWFISGFSEKATYYGFVFDDYFKASFNKIGELNNGFIEIERK